MVVKCQKENLVPIMTELLMQNHQLLGLNYSTFLNPKSVVFTHIEDSKKDISIMQSEMTEKVSQYCPDSHFITILNCFEMIKKHNYSLSYCIKRKNKESVKFSSVALAEMREIFLLTDELLLLAKDLIKTNNSYLANILDSISKTSSSKIRQYQEQHENRLIKGICMPKSSIIYLLMMEALHDMVSAIGTIGKISLVVFECKGQEACKGKESC